MCGCVSSRPGQNFLFCFALETGLWSKFVFLGSVQNLCPERQDSKISRGKLLTYTIILLINHQKCDRRNIRIWGAIFFFLPESWPPPPPPVPQCPPRRRSSKRPSSASLLLSGSEQSSPRPGPVRSGALPPPAAAAAAWARVPASPVWSPPTIGPRCLIPRSARWANCRLQPTNPMAFCTGPQAAAENEQAQQGPPASRACFLPFYILLLFFS